MAEATEANTFVPVLDKHGDVVLYDIFINGEWHGSRRTIAYAKEYYRGHQIRKADPSRHVDHNPHVRLAE